MRSKALVLLATALLASLTQQANASLLLGTAGDFAVLAGSTVTNTGLTVIDGGDVGVSPGSAITGFPPGTVTLPYTLQAADALALQAQNDLTTAYNAAAGLAPTQNLTGQDLGGLTLAPGVYFFSSSAQLTGTLTLNDEGDPNAQFVFQIGSTLTTASNSSVVSINGGSMPGCTVFWQIGSSATLGTGTAFEGHILALTSITMTTGATILDGSALARNGAVTLDSNTITNCVASVPEPATAGIALIGAAAALLARPGRAKRNSRNDSRIEVGTGLSPAIPFRSMITPLAVTAVLGACAQPSSAVTLVDGEGPQPVTGTYTLAGETHLATYDETYNYTGTVPHTPIVFDFSISSAVYSNPVTNGLDFVYQLTNTGPVSDDTDVFDRLTVSSFAGFSVDADYDGVIGEIAPTTVDRPDLDGSVVGYDFTGIGAGDETDLLIVRTNATEVTLGSASVIDGDSISAPAEVPFGAATVLPEPASMGLGAVSLSLLSRRRSNILR